MTLLRLFMYFQQFLRDAQKKAQSDLIPLEVFRSVLKDRSNDALKSVLKRSEHKGDIMRIKNGLYLMGKEYQKYSLSSFSVAGLMINPSYISLESALSYYQLIPEAVYTTTSVTLARTQKDNNDFGHFTFQHLRLKFFNHSFYQITLDSANKFLMASPLKAIVDLTYLNNKYYESLRDLEEDLRFDSNHFFSFKEFINKEKIETLKQIYHIPRIQKLLTIFLKEVN